MSSSYFGYPLSTTHVVSGGVLGVALGKRLAGVRWRLAGQMTVAWVLTLPSAALVAGAVWEVAHSKGSGPAGQGAMAAGLLFLVTQRRGAVSARDV